MGQDSLYRECCILHPELSASTTKERLARTVDQGRAGLQESGQAA